MKKPKSQINDEILEELEDKKTYVVNWIEEVRKSIYIKASSPEKARELWEQQEYNEEDEDVDDVNMIDCWVEEE
jgi:hypothetical protein